MTRLPEKFLTVHEAAEYLDVSTKTIRRWEMKGYLFAYRTEGNQRRFSFSQLLAFKNRKDSKKQYRPLYEKLEKPIEIPVSPPIDVRGLTYLQNLVIAFLFISSFMRKTILASGIMLFLLAGSYVAGYFD